MTGRDDIFAAGDLEQRLKQATRRDLPKRFYKAASVMDDGANFLPVLDGKPIRTPGKGQLKVPAHALAHAIAAEWDAQETIIDPAHMPLTRLVNTIVDRIAPARDDVRAEIVAYSGSDLLYYRAEAPETLVQRQDEVWSPVLRWAEQVLGARFVLVAGVMPTTQPPETLRRIAAAVASFDDFALGALASMTNLTGSALLALAVSHRQLTAGQAWSAAHVDEDFQISHWGQDSEAQARRDARWQDMQAAGDLCKLLEA